MIDIRKYPGEDERSAEVGENLAREFDLANRLFRYWARIEVEEWCKKSTLKQNSIYVAMTLAIQSVRFFRSILEECRRSEAMSALILSRSMFETSVALEFVLAPAIRIKAVRKGNDRFGKPKYVVKVGRFKSLTRDFRARLYMASPILQEVAHLEKVSSTKGFRRFGRSQERNIKPEKVDLVERDIGPEWSYVLRAKPSYSGLTIKETAMLTGKVGKIWHTLGYPLQCRAAHGVDAWKTMETVDDGVVNATAFSNDEDIRFALYCGTAFFLLILSILEENIGFGMNLVLNGFDQEAAMLYTGVSRTTAHAR